MTYEEAKKYFEHRLSCGQCGKETTQRFAFEEAIKALEIADRLEQAEEKDKDTIYDMCCRFSCAMACKGCSFRRRDLRCEKTTDFFNGYNQALSDIRGDTE